jgi:hypothetical protein
VSREIVTAITNVRPCWCVAWSLPLMGRVLAHMIRMASSSSEVEGIQPVGERLSGMCQ